jgi:hypothetical protein
MPTLKYTLIVSLFVLSVTAQSQDKKNETTTGTQSANITEEIEVINNIANDIMTEEDFYFDDVTSLN